MTGDEIRGALDNPVESRLGELAPGIFSVEGAFPGGIHAIQTNRLGGVSLAPYESFNLGSHVGDAPAAVARNRARLTEHCAADLAWLSQVHGTQVARHRDAAARPDMACQADALIADEPGRACLIMTADCLPILVARPNCGQVAAIHAGWRGLADGVIEATFDQLLQDRPASSEPDAWWIWFGPAIGPAAFEVGAEVRDIFMGMDCKAQTGFVQKPESTGKWLADLKRLAGLRIANWFDGAYRARGVGSGQGAVNLQLHVAQQNDCVFTQSDRYFSYRRDRVTGRMASLIYRD